MRMYVAGIQGMVGGAVAHEGKIQGLDVCGKTSHELNLTNRPAVFEELENNSVDLLVIAAAKVGGIGANSAQPVEFLSENLQIQTNLLDAAHSARVPKVLFIGSSCIYPKFAQQPISESSLLTGELEETNEAYAIAKIAGLKLVSAYRKQFGHNWISIMPTNLYGPRDNFNEETGHVLPALIQRFHKARLEEKAFVEVWGDGTPMREFLHVQDMAKACLLLLSKYDGSEPINVGSGKEISIRDLALMVAKIVGYEGEVVFSPNKPNGTPRKFLDSSRMAKLGWEPQIELEEGIATAYEWFLMQTLEGE
jgi:GDP-L-fucose synthase